MVICTCGSRVGKYLHDGGKTFEPSTNGVPGKLLMLHKSSSLFRQAKLQSSYIKKACLYILHTLCSITYIKLTYEFNFDCIWITFHIGCFG